MPPNTTAVLTRKRRPESAPQAPPAHSTIAQLTTKTVGAIKGCAQSCESRQSWPGVSPHNEPIQNPKLTSTADMRAKTSASAARSPEAFFDAANASPPSAE